MLCMDLSHTGHHPNSSDKVNDLPVPTAPLTIEQEPISHDNSQPGVDLAISRTNADDHDPPGTSNKADHDDNLRADQSWESIRELFNLAKTLSFCVGNMSPDLKLRNTMHRTLANWINHQETSGTGNLQDFRENKKKQRNYKG